MEVLRLKEVLREKKMSGKKLAETLGVSENTISFISTGKTQPRFELLLQIADALNIDVKDLFNSTKDKQTVQLIINNKLRTFDNIGELKNYVNQL